MDDLQQEQEPRKEAPAEPERPPEIVIPVMDDSIPSSIAEFFPPEPEQPKPEEPGPEESKLEPPKREALQERKGEEQKDDRRQREGQGQRRNRGGDRQRGSREQQEQRRPQSETQKQPAGRDQQEARQGRQQEPRKDQEQQRRDQQRQQGPRREGQQQRQHAEGDAGGGVDISVVVPLFNENESLRELSSQLKSVLSRMNARWEVWFIDDGSSDNSYKTLAELNRVDRRFKVARFRRNFGKSAALSVGFQHARGEYVVTMDADLQDDPQEIPRLIEKINSGFDLVSGWKKRRRDPINKTIPSKFFNFVTGKLSGIKIHDFNCGLKAYRKDVVKSVQLYGEMHRYIPVLAKMAGFTVSEIPVTHHPRKYGRTKFGMSRYFKGFLDLLTVLFTSRYNQRPLHLFGTVGLLFFLVGFAIEVYLSVEWWMGNPISNRPMLFLGILLILVGIQSISTGLLAEMIAKSQLGSAHYPTRSILK